MNVNQMAARLCNPTFIEHKEGLFIKGFGNHPSLENDTRGIAYAENESNHYHFDFLIEDSLLDNYLANLRLAEAICLLWKLALEKQFPGRPMCLTVINEITHIDQTDYTVRQDQPSHYSEIYPTIRLWSMSSPGANELAEVYQIGFPAPDYAFCTEHRILLKTKEAFQTHSVCPKYVTEN